MNKWVYKVAEVQYCDMCDRKRLSYSFSITDQINGPAVMNCCKPCMVEALNSIIQEAKTIGLLK